MKFVSSLDGRIYNKAMLEIITRAGLVERLISRAIISELIQNRFMKFGDLHFNICKLMDYNMKEETLRSHIWFTDDRLRAIDNRDIHCEVLVARIYEITVNVDDKSFTRFALVHNIR